MHAYPRPQLERDDWTSLNGEWRFALDPDGRTFILPKHVRWDRTITVPFAPETPASGVHETGYFLACWYSRTFNAPELVVGERLLIHFGAVDHQATVWLNGSLVGTHEGGYTPFMLDLTDFLQPGGEQTLVVRAYDDPHDLAKPRGKQDWQREPHSIWYYRTSGIWQTVWIERVPVSRIGSLRWTSSVERYEIGLDAKIAGEIRDGLHLSLRLTLGERVLIDDLYGVVSGEVHRRLSLSDPGIDDYRNELLWSPHSPTLIQAEIELRDTDGRVIDRVRSYTALRSVNIQGDRFVLNGRPYTLRMVLDQGYWPETGLTAPDDEAFRRDVELAKAMGFNGVRKHQKIEDPRYLYWADRLGLLVWGEMPSAYRFTPQSIERLTTEWMAAIERDISHPCIVAWVPFNESWGVPDLPDIPAQRSYIQAIYSLTKTLDPTRPVIGNDGWESSATDIIGIHDYDDRLERIQRRYRMDESLPRLFNRERPGGRLLTLEGHPHSGQPIMLTEFGGIAYSQDVAHTWGYSRSDSVGAFAQRYTNLLVLINSLPMLAGFCYTQFADTYQESNGLLYADRTPKFPLEHMHRATSSPPASRDQFLNLNFQQSLADLPMLPPADAPPEAAGGANPG